MAHFDDEPAALAEGELEPLLLQFLSDRDVACPLCGYNLRGLTSPRCPECGRELQLAVGLTEPYLRAWVALVVVAAASAGIGLLFLGVFIRYGWPGGWPWRISDFIFLYFVLTIPCCVLPIIWRRRFLRLRRKSQRWFAVTAVVVCAVAFGMLFIFLF